MRQSILTATMATLALLTMRADAQPSVPPNPDQSVTQSQAPPVNAEAQRAFQEIEQMYGFVPTIFRDVPDEGVAPAWRELRELELGPTSIPIKVKELIGVAVSAQLPCRYCAYEHIQTAKLFDASPREIKEAVAMAALTRQWSTVLQGMQPDEAAFRAEVDHLMAYAKNPHPAAVGMDSPPGPVVDENTAFKDMQWTLGSVPGFFRRFPSQGVAGAWLEFKAIQLSTSTALPGRYKELIGLAVASQIPCHYCVYFHTEAAKANGASDTEIREAIAMAALTRHWATIAGGDPQIDEPFMRREVNQSIRFLRRRMEQNRAAQTPPQAAPQPQVAPQPALPQPPAVPMSPQPYYPQPSMPSPSMPPPPQPQPAPQPAPQPMPQPVAPPY